MVRPPSHLDQRFQRRPPKIVPEKQVLTGVPRDRQLRKQHDGSIPRRLPIGTQNRSSVGSRVRHRHHRCRRHHPNKPKRTEIHTKKA